MKRVDKTYQGYDEGHSPQTISTLFPWYSLVPFSQVEVLWLQLRVIVFKPEFVNALGLICLSLLQSECGRVSSVREELSRI